jgi:hypothetical protein
MPPVEDASKPYYNLRRLTRIALAAVVTFCACLGFMVFANRDNPRNAPTLEVQGLATAATGIAPSGTPFQGQSVTLTLSLGVNGTVLNIHGMTNLPDRTILLYKVSRVAPDPISTEGTLAVLNGEYATQVDLSGWTSGPVEVWVGFQTRPGGNLEQPQEVIERYGETGENLHGENVIETDGVKRIEVRQNIELAP